MSGRSRAHLTVETAVLAGSRRTSMVGGDGTGWDSPAGRLKQVTLPKDQTRGGTGEPNSRSEWLCGATTPRQRPRPFVGDGSPPRFNHTWAFARLPPTVHSMHRICIRTLSRNCIGK